MMKDLNFIPSEHLEKKEKKKYLSHILRIILVIILGMVIFSSIPFIINVNLRAQKATFEKQASETSEYAMKEKQIEIIRKLYKEREDTSNKISTAGVDILKVYKIFEETLPQNVFLKSLNVKNEKSDTVLLNVNGMAKTDEDIAAFINILRKKNYVSYINLPGLSSLTTTKNQENGNGCEFSIDITINTGKW